MYDFLMTIACVSLFLMISAAMEGAARSTDKKRRRGPNKKTCK